MLTQVDCFLNTRSCRLCCGFPTADCDPGLILRSGNQLRSHLCCLISQLVKLQLSHQRAEQDCSHSVGETDGKQFRYLNLCSSDSSSELLKCVITRVLGTFGSLRSQEGRSSSLPILPQIDLDRI